ncbi:MAG: glycosyltransferase [Oscillospiraceae bacterium]
MTTIDLLLPAKNILVYDVAASESGALSVLNDFYASVRKHGDKSIQWFFVISTPVLEETENIKIIRTPWIKKNWLCRLFYDHFIAPRIIKKYNINKILSLQNVLVPCVNVPQIVYLHQSLPFAEYRFSITEDIMLWVYQNIISKFIFSAIKKSDMVVVQTEWMKVACIAKTGVDADKIAVIPPEIKIKPTKLFCPENMSIPTFIYPATPQIYKNHKVIIEACKQLVGEGITDFQILFTLTGKENKLSQRLYSDTQKYNLSIKFIGKISRDELFEWYAKAVLIFPSYIETYGLPLLEAKIHETPVIVAETLFAREILCDYSKFDSFSFDNSSQLHKILLKNMKTVFCNN